MRSQRSSAGRVTSIACRGSRSFVSCGLATGGKRTRAGVGLAAGAGGTAAGVAMVAGAVAVARAAPAVGAGCAAGAEPAAPAARGGFLSVGGLEARARGMWRTQVARTQLSH